MLKKLVLAVAVLGLIGAAASTASAQGYGRSYCGRPYYHSSFRPSYGGGYGYGGHGSPYGFRINRGYPVYGGYGGYGGYRGYGYGGSGISIRIGF